MVNSVFAKLSDSCGVPTPPGVVFKLLEMTRDSNAKVREIADTIAMDPGLTARILRFANSPMAGIGREVTSVQHAITLIGMRGVAMMSLTFAFLKPEKEHPCKGFDHQQFTLQSLACAVAAKSLAKAVGWAPTQEAFVAGLLSQLGRSTFASVFPKEYAQILDRAACVPEDLPNLERELFGESYPAVSAWLLRKWSIPEHICDAIAVFRNEPEDANMTPFSTILNVAERAAGLICPEPTHHAPDIVTFLNAAESRLNLEPTRAAELLETITKNLADARNTLDISAGSARTLEEIGTEVRDRVAELSVAMQLENQIMAVEKEELLQRTTTDAMTSVANRAGFDARLDMEMERSVRSDLPLGLLMIDVDHFKRFNDTYGHQAGDRVLQAVAKTLDEQVRKVDYLARYGGEEFSVIGPDSQPDGLRRLAERLRRAVEDLVVPWEGTSLSVTISIGAALLPTATKGDSVSRIIRLADTELYNAKRAGRNRVSMVVDSPVAEPATITA
jgi:diguanylate cyclase (GGDEF)-like protein